MPDISRMSGQDDSGQAQAVDLLMDALEHHRAGRLDDAERGYLDVLALNPEHADALHLNGVLCYQRGDLQQALELIRRAIALVDDAANYWSNLGNVLRARGDPAAAIDAYKIALERQPDLADALNNLGNTFAQSGQTRLATETLENLLRIHPNHAEAHNNLATLLKAAGDVKAAIPLFERAIELQPDYFDALCNLGNSLHADRRLEESLAAYARAVELDGLDAAAHRDYGSVFMALGRFETATGQFVIAKTLAPGDFRNSLALGNAYQKRGRIEEAEQEYREALTIEPDCADALNNLGTILRLHGGFEAALDLLDHALQLREAYAEAHFNRGTILVELGRLDEAELALLRSLELAPDFPPVPEVLIALYQRMGDPDRAIRRAEQWVADDPENPIARHVVESLGLGGAALTRCSEDYVRAEFDRAAQQFDSRLGSLDYRVPAYLASRLDRLFEGAQKGEAVILDAGCGTGLCGASLRPWARRLVGVDLSPKMLELAEARGYYDVLECADLVAYLGAQRAIFDFVALADVLAYFGDLSGVLRGVAGALKGGASVFCSLERLAGGGDYQLCETGRFAHHPDYVSRAFADAGFEAVTMDEAMLRLERRRPVMGCLVEAHVP